ncbi:MAG: VWA domain-containing protein [Saprospiraceae bacterium]
MSNLPVPTFGGDTAKNQEPRCLVVLVLDTSYSMDKDPIQELNKGLIDFADGIKRDTTARKRVEVAIITFDSEIKCIQEPALVDDFTMPTLVVNGTTKLVDGVRTSINFVEARKDWYRRNGLDYYRPHIVLMTDGAPDDDQDLAALIQELKIGGQGKHFVFMPVGVLGANQQVLNKIAQPDYPPLPLEGLEFGKFFKWLSKSISSVSKSAQNENVTFDNPDWIKKTGWGGGSFTQNPI